MSSAEFGTLYSRNAVTARTVVATGGSSSGGGLSPVEVCGSSNGAVDMDFGASPPHSAGAGGSPRCEATAVLSDLSSDITTIEERLLDVDLRGSAVALTSSSSPPIPANVVAASSSSNAVAAPSPTSSGGDGGVATTGFSLRSFAKPKPVVSATIEVSPGNNEKILLHDSDTPTSCRVLAAKFVEEHHLADAAIEPLSLHLWATLKAFLPQGDAPMGDGTAGSNSESLPGRRPPAKTSTVGVPPGRKATRQSSEPTAASSTTAAANARVKRQPSTPAISEESPTVTRRSTSGSRQYAHVAPRYQSPAPARPPPPEPQYSHTPQVCKSSVKLAKSLASSTPVYERLHAKDAEIQRKLQHKAAAAVAGTGRISKEFLHHHVKGCDWMGTSSVGFQNSGHRLYAQAERQQRALSEKVALAQKEREQREVEGVTFHPVINPSLRSSTRYHDPYRFDPSASTSAKSKLLSSEELELKQCTFRPAIHKPPSRATSPMNSATSTSAAGTNRGYARSPMRPTASPLRASSATAPMAGAHGPVGERSLLSQSPARRVISPVRGTTPTRSATATTSPVRKVSADPTKRPVSPMAPSDVEKMTARLFREAREREDRIQRTRKLLETIDTKTGKPFFRPSVGKRPPPRDSLHH